MSTPAQAVEVVAAPRAMPRTSAPIPIALHIGSVHVSVRYRSPSRLNLERRATCPR